MQKIFEQRWCDNPVGLWRIEYESRRDGANMQYRFYWKVWLTSSGGWFHNALKLPITLNGVNVKTVQVKYYNSNESGWTKSGTTEWFTVANKTSGTTPVSFQIVNTGGTAQAGWTVMNSASANLYVNPAGSDLGNINQFQVEDELTISITKYSSNFIDKLFIYCNDNLIKTVDNIANGSKVKFSTTELNQIYSLMSTVNSGTFKFTLTTYSGTTEVGSKTKTATGLISEANPIFTNTNVSYKDSNNNTFAVTQNRLHLVQNLSNLMVTITDAIAQKGATISRYEATINNITKVTNTSGNIDFGVINSGSNLTLLVKAIDSRGNSSSISKEVLFFPWVLPSAIISLKRKNNYENETFLKVDATFSSVNNKNSIEIKYQKKKSTEVNYSQEQLINNNVQTTQDNDKNFVWNYKIILRDKFGSTSYNLNLPKGRFIMFIDTRKLSIGINCFPTENESFEINAKLIGIYPVGSIYLSVNNINPSTLFGGVWEQIKDRFLLACGNTYANGSVGGEANVTLNSNQMPSHNHGATISNAGNHNHGYESQKKRYVDSVMSGVGSILASNTAYNYAVYYHTDSAGNHNHGITINNTGGNQAHNNMPPYLSVYMWKRIS